MAPAVVDDFVLLLVVDVDGEVVGVAAAVVVVGVVFTG